MSSYDGRFFVPIFDSISSLKRRHTSGYSMIMYNEKVNKDAVYAQ